ncbi:autotransporter domain-containing protein [Polaromonas sp. SP1]|nr:autotransporter domain-containing protein [Polaromonas sp. SP1]QGJ18319.1 autotransporter domain-containing protein [Polaromonas sp. Pch-P]
MRPAPHLIHFYPFSFERLSGHDVKTSLLTPLALALIAAYHPAANAQNELRGFGAGSVIWTISADGSTVGGSTDSPADVPLASTGTAGSAMAPLSGLGADRGAVFGLSADGKVATGAYLVGSEFHAFRWTSAGLVDLGTLAVGGSSQGRAVSGDGNVVVGEAVLASGAKRAVRWTQAGIQNIAAGFTNGDSSAAATSHDGSVIVGVKTTGTITHAFRWTEAAGMQDLGSLLGGPQADPYSEATGVSGSGDVVVGVSQAAGGGRHAFRWNTTGGMSDLGTLGGRDSQANAVSANGLVVVGQAQKADTSSHAFRWTETTGMQSVADWLAGAGVDSSRWELERATATNADGSIVVGTGRNGNIDEAWLARVSPIGSGVMQPANYTQSLNAVNASFHHAQSLTRMILWGSHHRPLMSYGDLAGQSCFWATGDAGQHTGGRDSSETLAEVGVCRDFAAGAVRAGLGLGYSRQNQHLGEFGSNRLAGNHVVAEVNYQLPSGPQLSATAVWGNWRSDIRRGYAGGAGTDHSQGSTDVKSTALRLHADWNQAWTAGAVALSPYVALTSTRTTRGAYTETGGGFPARFDDQAHSSLESRVGLASSHAINGATQLRGSLELAHRFDGNGPALNGQALGLFSFNQSGAETRRSWMRAGVDLDHRLSRNTVLSFSVHAASRGEDPGLSAALSLRVGF